MLIQLIMSCLCVQLFPVMVVTTHVLSPKALAVESSFLGHTNSGNQEWPLMKQDWLEHTALH